MLSNCFPEYSLIGLGMSRDSLINQLPDQMACMSQRFLHAKEAYLEEPDQSRAMAI